MSIVLRPLQAVTNAPCVYDYCWMHTLVENIAMDQKGNLCRLVENEDEWHFRQQLMRYGSGLHLAIDDQEQLDNFLRNGWLKLTDNPIFIHRFKVDLENAFDDERGRRVALLRCLLAWRNAPTVSYRTGSRADYFFTCRGDVAADEVRLELAGFGLRLESWGPATEAAAS